MVNTPLSHVEFLNTVLPAELRVDPAYVVSFKSKGCSAELLEHVILDRLEARLSTLSNRTKAGTWAADLFDWPEYELFKAPYEGTAEQKENVQARTARPTETQIATTACTCWACAVQQRPVFLTIENLVSVDVRLPPPFKKLKWWDQEPTKER